MRALRTILAPVSALVMGSAVAQAQEPAPTATPAADVVLLDSLDVISREYFDQGVTREELVEAALRGMVDHLNRRATRQGHPAVNSVLSRREMSRLTDSMSGRVVGIGVYAKPSAEGIDVLHVFEGSPAGKAGLRKGDRIVSVDDRAVAPLLSAVGFLPLDLLRGEDGTAVKLTVVRDTNTRLDVKLTRRAYSVSPIAARMFDNDVGYLKIASFTRGAAEEVGTALLDMKSGGRAWALVLDLRGNPGGSLEEATAIASMFVDPGRPLLQIQGRFEARTVSANGEVLWPNPLPVAVLIDSGTASAAEALASALQTSKRAYLVGERTSGRGLGESIFALPTGGALRIATARYATALGESWIQRGLTPDSAVLSLALEPDDDPPLRAALNILSVFRQTAVAPNPDPTAIELSPINLRR